MNINDLKFYLKRKLEQHFKGIIFNGDPEGNSLYTLLSVGFPRNEKSDVLLFNLDVNNICASGGSACSSGAEQGSHVISALGNNTHNTVRFSFSKFNTKDEIDILLNKLLDLN